MYEGRQASHLEKGNSISVARGTGYFRHQWLVIRAMDDVKWRHCFQKSKEPIENVE